MRARPEPAFAPPGKRRRYFKCPFADDKPGWKFVRRLVGNCVFRDFRKSYRWSLEDRAVVKTQAESARIKHLLSLKVYERWRQMRLCQDDAGGKVPGGKLLLRPYALFQLSLDRVDNDRPHFPEHELQNLHFVPLGMNTPKSVVGVWGKHACRCLRERVEKDNRNAFPARADVIFRRAVGNRNNKNKVYKAARNIYSRDGTTRAHFETFDFFEYVVSLLKRQRGRCAVSVFSWTAGTFSTRRCPGLFPRPWTPSTQSWGTRGATCDGCARF